MRRLKDFIREGSGWPGKQVSRLELHIASYKTIFIYLFIYLFRVRITFKHRKRIRLAKPFTNAPANKEQNLH